MKGCATKLVGNVYRLRRVDRFEQDAQGVDTARMCGEVQRSDAVAIRLQRVELEVLHQPADHALVVVLEQLILAELECSVQQGPVRTTILQTTVQSEETKKESPRASERERRTGLRARSSAKQYKIEAAFKLPKTHAKCSALRPSESVP